jgi:glycosyltransferase involved in cell wall biosynthesis
MKIGIDASILSISYECGLKRYQRNIIENLAKFDDVNQYYIFSPKKIDLPRRSNFKLILLPRWMPIFKRQIVIPFYAHKLHLDIFHFPDVWGSIIPPCTKTIVTLQDLGPHSSYPSIYENPRYFILMILNNFVKLFTLRYASVIIVPSNFTKNEYEVKYGSDERLRVIHNGLPYEFSRIRAINYKKDNYFLAFSDFSPRKNIIRVLGAFKMFNKSHLQSYKLICVCSSESAATNLKRHVKRLKLSKFVDIKVNLSTLGLIDVYRSASALIYPSLYEGFGLPIIEAMSCGCPVITSNYGSMKEVSCGGSLLVDPRSLRSISEAMSKVIDKKVSNKLIKDGLKISRKYSWKNATLKIKSIYEKL